MDEETRRRCVEPFFTTKGQRGTGLGLASVYGMLQRHDARLEIDSVSGQGTTMRMVFPAFVDDSAASGKHLSAHITMRRLRILVIDDDPILIRSMRDVLEADEKDIPPNIDRVLSKPPRLAQLRAALVDLAG
jgi:hypothetical protein